VPDAKTAIKIAVAVWEPIYGEAQIAGEKPYHADLKNGVWTVEGSLPNGWKGGVAIAKISKSDGTVLLVIHEK
jgi:NTF2 fold immunity protein